MTNQSLIKSAAGLIAAFTVTFYCSLSLAGGTDGGGNGLFIETPFSRTLVLWDIVANCFNCGEDAPGDQIRFKNEKTRPGLRGEWIDYRKFQSFALMKERLAKWAARAPNLIALLGEGGFLDGSGITNYRLLLIGTKLHVNITDEISVSPAYSNKNFQAYPSAYFEDATGKAYLDIGLWNRAGLSSQAGMLLHERMRSLQMNFYLTNEELQNAVFNIIKRDPDQVSISEFDDSHFTKSWRLIHRKNISTEQAAGPLFTSLFQGKILDCVAANDWLCIKQVFESSGQQQAMPHFDPAIMLVADSDVDDAEKNGILTSGPLVGKELVSTGVNNTAAVIPPGLFFSNMMGQYKITGCKDLSANEKIYNYCDGYKTLAIYFVQNKDFTIISFRKPSPEGGTQALTTGQGGRTEYEKLPYFKYVEQGDSLASYVMDNSSIITKGQTLIVDEITMRRLSDGIYTLSMKGKMQQDLLPQDSYDYSFEISLRKE